MSTKSLLKLRLYIAGNTHNSTQALVNLRAFCKTNLNNHYELEVIDVFKDTKRALADGVFLTPTLVKLQPSPVRKVIGTLSEIEQLQRALELETSVV